MTDTIDLRIRPIAPARTTGHPDMHTAALGIDFHYKGVPTIPIAYSPTIVLGDVFPEDIERRQHPSSQLLWGRAVRVDGIAGEPVNLNFIFGSSFAARWGLRLDDFGGYLDGEVPETGFTASMAAAPSFSINMGRVEDFRVFAVWNHNFSARDIQVGVFREAPRFIDIQMEPSGVRVFWNADTNRTYTLESRSTPDGAPSVLGTNLTGPDFLDAGAGPEAARFYRLQEE